MKQKTREELLAEIAKLEIKNAHYVAQDIRVREEFAKAFAWYKLQQPFQYRNESRDPQIPTWEQIFVNVGYLTSQRDFRNYEGNISEIEVAIADMKGNWDKYFKDKRDFTKIDL